MLVLSRKAGEGIVIGRNVSIRVLDIRGNRVRVGITAPDSMAIHREELRRRIEESDSNHAPANDRKQSDEAVQ